MSATRWWWCLSVVAVSVEQTHCEFPSFLLRAESWIRGGVTLVSFRILNLIIFRGKKIRPIG